MKLKIGEDGKVALDEKGMPVWVTGDGKEIAYDVPQLVNDLQAANAQAAGRRKDIERLTEQYKPFDGLDIEKVKKGLDLQALYDEGKLKDSAKLDELKASIEASFKGKFEDQEKRHAADLSAVTEKMTAKDAMYRQEKINALFGGSAFLRDKTVLPPEVAAAYFGGSIDFEEADGVLKVVGKVGGQPVFSRSKPGQLAQGDEIIEAIIDAYPAKDAILRGSSGGGGARQNHGGAGGKTLTRAAFDQLGPQEKHAHLKDGGTVTD